MAQSSFECVYCSKMTLRELLDLAQRHLHGDFSPDRSVSPAEMPLLRFDYNFPSDAYLRHHQSWQGLEESARNGCELCSTIYDEFVEHSDELRLSVGNKIAAGLKTDIRICLDSFSGRLSGGSAPLFDALIIQVGDHDSSDDPDEDSGYDVAPRVVFQLNREGKCQTYPSNPQRSRD